MTPQILHMGRPLADAQAAMILVHGRGADAASILSLVPELESPASAPFAFLAPEAPNGVWYPNRFNVPTALNEPYLTAALDTIDQVVAEVGAAGIPPERLIVLGFSQGASLTLEYAARHAQHFGAIIGLSGGLIGGDGEPRHDSGTFAGTPIFLGCSDVDPHIPKARVEQSAEMLRAQGADVTMRLYRGMGHTINEDELTFVRAAMVTVLEEPHPPTPSP